MGNKKCVYLGHYLKLIFPNYFEKPRGRNKTYLFNYMALLVGFLKSGMMHIYLGTCLACCLAHKRNSVSVYGIMKARGKKKEERREKRT